MEILKEKLRKFTFHVVVNDEICQVPGYLKKKYNHVRICLSYHFPFHNKYQGILRKMHFKRLWSIMYINYHSNWKEIYVANSSPLFETLKAVYSSALNTWSRLESHSGCSFRLSNYKTRQFPTIFILRVFLHYLFVRCNPNGNLS